MYYFSFLEIIKNVVCFLLNDLVMIIYYRILNMLSMLNKISDGVNELIIGILSILSNNRFLFCFNVLNGVEKCFIREIIFFINSNGRIRE